MKKIAILMMVMGIATMGMLGSAKAADLYLGGKIPIAIPLPDFNKALGVGGGLVAEADYFVMPGLAVTGEFGFIHHGGKDITVTIPFLGTTTVKGDSTTQVPLMVGVRYEFMEGPLKPFAHLRLGLNFLVGGVTNTKFGLNFGGGVLYEVIESLDVGGSLEFGFAGLDGNAADQMHFIINIMALYGLM